MHSRYRFATALAVAGLGSWLLMAAGCPITPTPPVVTEPRFIQTNLVSDGSQAATFVDTNLVNPWGLVQRPAGPFWVADNGTGVSTLYTGTGQPFPVDTPLVVTIPAPIVSGAAAPTGVVFNTAAEAGDFGGNLFLFVTEDGTVAAWQPSNGTTATQMVNNFVPDTGPVYKGAALVQCQDNFLLVANFRDARIDIFDKDFMTATLAGDFTDSTIPAGFAPFNVVTLNDKVYVAYARQDADKADDVAGAGNGYINEFDMDGTFIRRIASQGTLNSPWGMAIGPAAWNNEFSGTLIVGNFGDGKINAFSLGTTPAFVATFHDDTGADIVNPGLWALVPGNGAQSTDPNKLYLTAGGAAEDRGLFASLELAP